MKPLAGHPYHSKTCAELRYILKDASEAAEAMRGHAPDAEAKYLDQVNDAATVLHYRATHPREAAECHPYPAEFYATPSEN